MCKLFVMYFFDKVADNVGGRNRVCDVSDETRFVSGRALRKGPNYDPVDELRGRCVQCVADSDCNPTRKYCFQNKCSAKLSVGATCVRDSWCAAGNCTDNVCGAIWTENGRESES